MAYCLWSSQMVRGFLSFTLLSVAAGSLSACDQQAHKPKVLTLMQNRSTLVCVTAYQPPDVSATELDDVYQSWIDAASSHEGFVSSLLFRLENDGSESEQLMFGIVFDNDPDGMTAAQHFRQQEYEPFAARLRELGFTRISDQSNLLYIKGDNCSGRSDAPGGSCNGGSS